MRRGYLFSLFSRTTQKAKQTKQPRQAEGGEVEKTMLRRCCAHVLAELTDPSADLRTLSEQMRQTGALVRAELDDRVTLPRAAKGAA